MAPPPDEKPSDWAERCAILPGPQTDRPGPVSFDGTEYCRALVDDFADTECADSVNCFGSQSAKTTALQVGAAWTIRYDPGSMLWVFPNRDLAKDFAESRWIPFLEATPELMELKPVGRERNKWKVMQQAVGGASVVFIGSNSPANLSSRPVRRVLMDETDKFDEGGRGEADAINLAEQRTKRQSLPQRFKTSTPTLESGVIWREFTKGNQQRYFVPCPSCGKRVLLAWSKNYYTLPKTGCEAYVVWDKEARQKSGWDLARVERSARFVCPTCAFHIQDRHKFQMNKNGIWVPGEHPSARNAHHTFKSRHLPSLYSTAPETAIGRLAVKFLQAQNSVLGLQGFINGDLAEPYRSQDTMQERTELVLDTFSVKEAEPMIQTVDCQEVSPFYWTVVRAWGKQKTTGIMAAACDTIEDVRRIQQTHKIPDTGVIIDSGYGARSDANVYGDCGRFSTWMDLPDGKKLGIGWNPSKGMPGRKRWRHPERKTILPWYLSSVDPYSGSANEGTHIMNLFEFAGDFFKDVLAMMRKGSTDPMWCVAPELNQEFYWHQMDGELKKKMFNKMTGFTTYQWVRRSKSWPNHIFDCEVLQVAYAVFLGLLDMETLKVALKEEHGQG